MLLGEACSKCEFIAGIPLSPQTSELLHQISLERGARATTAIEGNTLSEEEVSRLARGELKLPPSKEYLGKEVQNILDACNEMLNTSIGRLQPANGLGTSKVPECSGIEWTTPGRRCDTR